MSKTREKFYQFLFFIFFSAFLPLFLGSCLGSSGSNTVKAPPSNEEDSSDECTTKVVDYGNKGVAVATARGVYSDVQIIPDTSTAVTVFTDPASVAIKLSWWNGSSYSVEVVSGEGAGAFVKLAFNSSGIPFVFWTSGTRVRAASRSAPLSNSNGVWTGTTIDTGVAPRALEVKVSPLDDILLGYYTDTAATGRFRVAICSATCNSASSFQSMSVATPYVENVNIQAAAYGVGVSWCRGSSTQYYPTIAYSTSAATRYGVCLLGNCLDPAGWSLVNVVATATVNAKLMIDSSSTGDIPKVMHKGAGGLVPYTMNASTACTSAPAAFSAGAALAASTNVGTQWYRVLKASDGKFHLAGNNTTTSVYYYNTSSTAWTGAWNAANTATPADTVTLATPSTGGVVLDSTNNKIYISYGSNAANYNIFNSTTDTSSTSATATFSRNIIDTTGQMILSAANGQRASIGIAMSTAGRPAVAWVDASAGAAANSLIKYAMRSGTDASSSWDTVALVDQLAISPQYPALGLDENNAPWISYFDASVNRFYLAHNSQPEGTAQWEVITFPALPSGAPAAYPAANNTALGFYTSGGQKHPVMIVIDTNAGSRGVKASMYNKSTRKWSSVVTIDALAGSGAEFVNVVNDGSGNLAVAYYDITSTRVEYSYSTNGTSWSVPYAVTAVAGNGIGLTMALHPSTGKPAMAYYNRANNQVYYHYCTASISGCGTGGWSVVLVESNAGVSGITNVQEQLLSAALSFKSDGTINIFYTRGAGNDAAFIRASSSDGVSFSSSTFVSPNANGISLTGIAALNFGIPGWNAQALTNGVGNATVAFIGAGNYLMVRSCGD